MLLCKEFTISSLCFLSLKYFIISFFENASKRKLYDINENGFLFSYFFSNIILYVLHSIL